MRVITRRPFMEAEKNYPNDAQAIRDVFQTLKRGHFADPLEMRQVFPSLDNFKYRDKWWVINIGGNNLRLLACILFRPQIVYVKHIVTHPEYDRLTERARRGEL